MIRKCLICSKPFNTKPTWVRKGKGKYCSKKCYYVSLKGHQFRKGKLHTQASKKKMSLAHKGKHNSPATEFKKGQNTGSNNFKWKGGTYIDKDGYKRIKIGNKYILEHRLVMQKHIQRPLKSSEIVHHIDGNIKNNHISNLQICTQAKHRKIHLRKH